MKDPKGLFDGKGKYVRHVKIRSAKDVDEVALSALIVQVG